MGAGPGFGFLIPKACNNIPSELLNPWNSSPSRTVYEERSKKLASRFKENFKQFEKDVSRSVLEAAPC
jgi:phosphoenolpyruvate carboxykinase (ATP)